MDEEIRQAIRRCARLRRVEQLQPRRAEDYGGKAVGLAALARGGFPVPAAYALSGEACELALQALLGEDATIDALLSRRVSKSELEALREKVRTTPLPNELVRSLRDTFRALSSSGAKTLAVRSSSTLEDGDLTSAAGLFESIIDVRDEAALQDAVRACWASLYTERVLEYASRSRAKRPERVGVVVQALVPAEVAGVAFTANPLTRDRSEIVTNAAYGLGSGVVDGSVSPDTWRIDKDSLEVRECIVGEKASARRWTERGIEEGPVAAEQRVEAALDVAQVKEIAALARRIEEHFRGPRDVEWALFEGRVYVLQARPITTLPAIRKRSPRAAKKRENIVWSNVNVGEALPGVATPLTWSVLSSVSDAGFRRAFGSIGCSVPSDAELVGSFRGRIYLNLSEFTSILTQVPGIRPKLLLSLGGGGEAERLEADLQKQSSRGFLLRLPKTVARYANENRGLSERVNHFEQVFESERTRLLSVDPRVLNEKSLNQMLRDTERLLDHASDVMLTVYGNLLSSAAVLAGLLSVVAPGNTTRTARDLLTGLSDLDSAAPGLRLWHIAESARAQPEAETHLLGAEPEAWTIDDVPDGPTKRALEAFLKAYGHRGAREAELAEARWSEDPALLLVALKAHLRSSSSERPIDREKAQRALRDQIEKNIEQRLLPPARPMFRHLLSFVRRYTRLRERLRGHVIAVLGLMRIVALEVSRRLERNEPEVGDDAAFYLTLDELHAVLQRPHSVATRVRQRKARFERDRSLPNPPDTFVGYPPSSEHLTASDVLEGLAASGGIVEGRARVVRSAKEALSLEPGEILVTAFADVGWAPLFLVASGVVSDLGGPLSHASIVLREYGVPAVVNVKSGTHSIATGDWIRLDGDRGEVRVLERRE